MSHICLKHGSFYLLPVTCRPNLVERERATQWVQQRLLFFRWRIWRIYGAFLQIEKLFSYVLCWRVSIFYPNTLRCPHCPHYVPILREDVVNTRTSDAYLQHNVFCLQVAEIAGRCLFGCSSKRKTSETKRCRKASPRRKAFKSRRICLNSFWTLLTNIFKRTGFTLHPSRCFRSSCRTRF